MNIIMEEIIKIVKSLKIKQILKTSEDCWIILSNLNHKMKWDEVFGYNEDEIRIEATESKVEIDIPNSNRIEIIYSSSISNPQVFDDVRKILQKHFATKSAGRSRGS